MKTQTGYDSYNVSFRKTKRATFEFYPTPPEATRALLSEVSFDGSIWEPACGKGDISKVLIESGYDVVSTDLIDRGFGTGSINFLNQTNPLAKNIVTNPPYGFGLGDKFIKHALINCRKTGGKVAMLLNLSSLCYFKRTEAFKNTPPKAIYALDDLTCYPYGEPSQASYSIKKQRYCWVIWEIGFTGRPEFWWFSTKDFRKPKHSDSFLSK